MGLESILGGFAKGFGQARMMKMGREKDKEASKANSEMMKLKIEEAKRKAQREKIENTYYDLMMQSPKVQKALGLGPGAGEAGQAQPVSTEPSFGKSFEGEGGGGVTDKMSMMQMDPLVAEIMKMASGGKMDFPNAIRTGQGNTRNEIAQGSLDLRQKQFDRGATETKFQNIPTGGGGSQVLEFPKFGGSSGTARLMGTSPAPTDFEERTKGAVTQRRVINKATKQPEGKWRNVSGKKGMSGEGAGKLGMVQSGLSDLKLAKDILMPGGKVNKKRLFEMAIPGGGMPKSEGREAKAYLLNAMEGKIRIESGAAVPDQEMERLALRFMPSLLDSEKLVRSKLNRLESYLNGVVEKLDPNKNYGSGTLMIAGESGEQFAWVPKGAPAKMPDPLGIRE